MRITEHEIWAFLLGAAIASVITYWNTTREKRFVSRVRRAIETLGYEHKFDQWPLTPGWRQKTANVSEIATYEEILALHPWADRVSYHLYPRAERIRREFGMSSRKSGITLLSEVITAEAIICEKLLGLSHGDGLQFLRSAKTHEDLGQLALTAICKKEVLNHINKVVWPALQKYCMAERVLSHESQFPEWKGGAATATARQKAVLAACEATNEIHQLADFVTKQKLPSLLFAKFKDVRSAVETRCSPAADVSLFHDVADAVKRLHPDGPSATVSAPADAAPISMGFGLTRPDEQNLAGFGGIGIIITDRNGEIRTLVSVLQNVFDAWMKLLGEPLSQIDD